MNLSNFKDIFTFELLAINNWSCNQNSYGYKPFKLSNEIKFKTTLHYYKENLLKIITLFTSKNKVHPRIKPTDILFILEYNNHLKIYEKLAPLLDKLNVSHSALYVNEINSNKNNFIGDAFQTLDFSFIFYKFVTDIYLFVSSPNINSIFEKFLLSSKMLLNSYFYFKGALFIKNIYQPKLVIFFRVDGIINRSLTLGLKKETIPNMCIQHGSITNHPIFSNVLVDEFVSWGEIFSNYIIQSGSSCKTKAIGSVEYDELFLRAQNNIYTKLGTKIKLLLMTPSGISYSLLSDKDLMLKLARSIDRNKYEITFKPHPGDLCQENEVFAKKLNFEYLPPNYNLSFENYDIIILNNSSSGIESAIFSKPLILVAEKLDNIVVKHYLNEEIGLFASDETTFIDALNKIELEYTVFQGNCKKFTNKYLANHGKATEKLADYLSTKVCVA